MAGSLRPRAGAGQARVFWRCRERRGSIAAMRGGWAVPPGGESRCRKGCGQSAAYASEAMPRPTRCRQPEQGGARRVRRGEDGVFAAEGCEAVEDRCG